MQDDEREIRNLTEDYWRHLDDHPRDYDYYIDKLLGRELGMAAQKPERLRSLAQPVHALAMTVGDSFEPLLQMVCVLKPQRLVLILNHDYSGTPGKDYGADLRRFIKRLSKAPDLPDQLRPQPMQSDAFDCIEIPQDTPTEVFRALTQAFQKAEAQPPTGYVNAVDITGAKKSMVVGAFLYAAHSGLPITYVDFEEYSSKWHRPYGYKCKIGQIPDPYEAFRLRDWEQVRQAYQSYNFRGACTLIGQEAENSLAAAGILKAMSAAIEGSKDDRTLYDRRHIDKVKRLVATLKMYEAWDSGDFNAAANLASNLSAMELPTVVEYFGKDKKWFSITGSTFSNIPSGFYGDEVGLWIYAHDELARIQRLVDCNEDNRSAFLRAAGLNEVLLTARLVRLVVDPTDRAAVLSTITEHPPNARELFKTLQTDPKAPISPEKVGLRKAGLIRPILRSAQMKDWWSKTRYFSGIDDWEKFLELRNKLAHTFMSVSKELAEDAICFVQANFEDFIGAPVTSLTTTVKALDWGELCNLCKLDFLPPKLRN